HAGGRRGRGRGRGAAPGRGRDRLPVRRWRRLREPAAARSGGGEGGRAGRVREPGSRPRALRRGAAGLARGLHARGRRRRDAGPARTPRVEGAPGAPMSWRVGIDIGGTFTDFALQKEDGVVLEKTL